MTEEKSRGRDGGARAQCRGRVAVLVSKEEGSPRDVRVRDRKSVV